MRPLTPSGSLGDICGKAESVRNSKLNSLSDQIVADIYGNAELITKQVLSKRKRI